MQSSDSDSDTDDEYVLEEVGSMDLSEGSDDDIGEDGEDEIFHSVKRYGIFLIDLIFVARSQRIVGIRCDPMLIK